MVTQDPDGSLSRWPVPLATRRKRWCVLLATATLLLAGGFTLYFIFFRGSPGPPPSAPRDPRLEYAGPFLNVDPAVRYVSDDRCADCHSEIARSFADHPMGRSLVPIARALALPEGPGHNLPFEAMGLKFTIGHDKDRVWHRVARLDQAGRPAAEMQWQVDYVIGSGTRGHSYLSDRDGYLCQTPISWFSQKQKWDVSPGFKQDRLTGRPVLPECLNCHANRANYIDGSVNRYREPVFDGHAIGCQRCHGPGELHVVGQEQHDLVVTGLDPTIVNPRHLEPALRNAVCEQCHLLGKQRILRLGRRLDDFRPGLPPDLFWSVFVRAPEAGGGDKAVDQVEQMYESRCFRSGAGPERLGCTSCHDPHERVAPGRRFAYYRNRCLQCHQQKGCSLPLADRVRRTKEDSCIDCHMPRYDSLDIAHTASTNHRIPRDGKAALPSNSQKLLGDGFPVVSFYRDRTGVDRAENDRDLAVALVEMALGGQVSDSRTIGRIVPLLEEAEARDPDDGVAGEAFGYALGMQGRWANSLAAFETVLAKAPDREQSLVGAATAAERLKKTEAMLTYWRRAIEVNPWAPEYRRSFVMSLLEIKAWEEARPECEAWIRLDLTNAEARSLRVICLLAADEKEEARAEFARVEVLAPPNLPELKARFSKKLK
jgi:hypothetical protein